jgi:subtilase family serine protease
LSITQTWHNRLLITAEGTVADVQKAFHTQIGLFLLNGTTFYNCTGNIQVPTSLSSCGITNINVNNLEMQSALSNSAGIAPDAVAYNSSPADFRDAYGTNTQVNGGWNGTGTSIAIVDAFGDPTIRSDIDLFSSHFGLPSLNLTIAGTGGIPVGSWDVETALDVEWAHTMAPDAAITLQLEPNSQSNSLFAAVNTLVQQENPPNIISLSWDGPETSSYSYIFEAALAKGINVYVSTGDNGAYNGGGASLSVGYPASDPNVVAVGGTTLNYNIVQGTREYYEYGWSGSGGGYSKIFSEPTYQINVGITDPTAKRAIPDVSLNADPASGVSIYLGGHQQTGWGGTSLSAPIMAGIAADALNGNWSLNNNVLYGLYNSPNQYNASFHDVYLNGNNGYYGVQSG